MFQGVHPVMFPILFESHQREYIDEIAGKSIEIDMFYDLQDQRVHGDNKGVNFSIPRFPAIMG